MKIARVVSNGQIRVGVVEGEEIFLLSAAFADVTDLIEHWDAESTRIRELMADGALEKVALTACRLLPPLGRFRRDVLCTGWNYHDHFEEGQKMRGETKDLPKAPTFFTKAPEVVTGPNDAIAYDARLSTQWDYEAEVAIIIGKTGRSIPQDEALDHVFGFCLANDVSLRDLQRRHGGQWLKGKSIDRTMPLGPWIVTRDEITDLGAVRLQCILNGEIMQDAHLRQMAFPLERLIAEMSFGMTLHAGDVILTGTPSGVGFARTPPVYLAAGDEVIVTATGLGELRNRVEEADLAGRSQILLDYSN